MATNALLAWAGVLWATVGILTATDYAQDKYRVVCYMGSWSTYRTGNGKYSVSDIDPKFCTHLIYSFAGLDNKTNTIRSLDPYLDDTQENYKKFISFKEKKPELKIMIAIGGWSEGGFNYSKMAFTPESRTGFVQSVVQFLSKYGFDGLDLDWEYPGVKDRDGKPEDKANFVSLVKELRQEFDSRQWLLTAAIGAGKSVIDVAYDIPQLSKDLDFINVMTYDYHGQWDKQTGHNSPLYESPKQPIPLRTKNINFTINYLISLGSPPKKLNLGMPIYGRTFTLLDPANTDPQMDAPDPGSMGPYTKEANFMGYNEICEEMQKNQWTEAWDQYQQVPYAYRNKEWISYDNPASIQLKVDFLKDHRLGGAMVWSLETDDFRGICGNGSYPVMTAINMALLKEKPTTKEPLPTTTTSMAEDTTMANDTTTKGQDNSKSPFFGSSSFFVILTVIVCWKIS